VAGRLHAFTRNLHLAAGDGGGRLTAGLEETRDPQPFIQALGLRLGLLDGSGHYQS
jgi:hypothetical protein